MLNHITVMGRVVKNPELRHTNNGTAVTTFTIACNRNFKGSNGEKETDFIDIVVWRNTAEFVERYFTKGRMAVVSGRLQIRKYTDEDGSSRRIAEIIAENVYFGDSKSEAPAAHTNDGAYPGDDDLPF